jgi:hypothetical protein
MSEAPPLFELIHNCKICGSRFVTQNVDADTCRDCRRDSKAEIRSPKNKSKVRALCGQSEFDALRSAAVMARIDKDKESPE